jgi:hypothetical protein
MHDMLCGNHRQGRRIRKEKEDRKKDREKIEKDQKKDIK